MSDYNPSIVALVPMRHQSERVPQKNYRSFAGQPLYYCILNSLLSCSLITEVVVNTDSPIIVKGIIDHFPQVRLVERPDNLRGGEVPMNDVLLHDVQQVKADYYLQTHSTNPLLRSDTITDAIRLFVSNYPKYDSLFSVTRVQTRLWDSLSRPLNHNPAILLRTQDLPPIYEENSCIYIFTKDILEKNHNRIGDRPIMFEIDRQEAWDIDEELDFELAQHFYQKRLEENEES